MSLIDELIFAFDVGQRHIGVAVKQRSTTVITPRPVLSVSSSEEGKKEIIRLVEKEKPGRIVIGLPLTMRGEIGPQAAEIQDFVAALQMDTPCPIILQDERLTTAAGRKTMASNRQRDDSAAAAQILETYLQQNVRS